MKRWWVTLAIVGCGQPRVVVVGDDSGGTTTTTSSTSDAPPVADDSTTTTGSTPDVCVARRYSLLDDEQCRHAAIGDLDADGHADLFVMPGPEQSFILSSYLHRLHTFRGGAAELEAPELHCCLDGVGSPTSLGLLDVNEDGRADPLYAIEHDYSSGDVAGTIGYLDLLVRGPMGGYLTERSVATGRIWPLVPRAAIGALTPDPDRAAVVVSDGDAELRTLVADGLSLQPATLVPFVLPGTVLALATTDLDDDGIEDVVALLSDRVSLIRSAGDGTLTPLSESTPPGLGPRLLVGDLDGVDGRDVVLVGDEGSTVGLVSSGAIVWHAQPGLVITAASVLVDVDGDGALDLVTVEGTTLVAYRRSGWVFAGPPVVIAQGVGDEVRTIVAGDLDGDARVDVAVCDRLGVLVVSSGGA
jgi:hypothetical protein